MTARSRRSLRILVAAALCAALAASARVVIAGEEDDLQREIDNQRVSVADLERLDELVAGGALRSEDRRAVVRRIEGLRTLVPLAGHIEEFWLEPEHQAACVWQAHVDINAVMLATSLVPDGFLQCELLGQR